MTRTQETRDVFSRWKTEAEQERAMARLQVEQARAAARREERAAEQAARADLRKAAAAERRERRTVARDRRRVAWTQRRALLSVLPIMAMSAAVALPAQLDAFHALTGSAWLAAAIAAMVEGGTWAGAAMESIAVRRSQPTGAYVALTWGCAAIACSMNVAHGLAPSDGRKGSAQLALAYGLASLLGPTVWAVYSRLQRHIVSGRTGEQAMLAAVRRARYPLESWRALSLRAARGADVTVEDAWATVWAAREARAAARRSPASGRRAPAIWRRSSTATVAQKRTSVPVAPAPVVANESPTVVVDAVAAAPAPASVPVDEPNQQRRGRRSRDELRLALSAAIAEGRVPEAPTVEQVRASLGCRKDVASELTRELRSIRETPAAEVLEVASG